MRSVCKMHGLTIIGVLNQAGMPQAAEPNITDYGWRNDGFGGIYIYWKVQNLDSSTATLKSGLETPPTSFVNTNIASNAKTPERTAYAEPGNSYTVYARAEVTGESDSNICLDRNYNIKLHQERVLYERSMAMVPSRWGRDYIYS